MLSSILTTLFYISILSVMAAYKRGQVKNWEDAYTEAFRSCVKATAVVYRKVKKSQILQKLVLALMTSKPEQAPQVYPVYIGVDDSGYTHADIIEQEFKPVLDKFYSYYFTNFKEHPNRLLYSFAVNFFKEDINDSAERVEYLRQIAESTVHGFVHTAMPYSGAISNLVAVNLLNGSLHISLAKNPAGAKENADFWNKLRRKLKEQQEQAAPDVIIERWGENACSEMSWGYNLQILEQTSQKVNICLPVDTHPHALITGASGSGKSKSLQYLLGKLVISSPHIEVYVCDFKNSPEFAFLEGLPHYYAGDNCYDGIMAYYKRFQQARENGEDCPRHLLICDEYPSLVSYLQGEDKANKTHKADDVLLSVSNILMLGRGTANGFGLWIATQRPDAALFKGGSRDNFMIVLALGRLSKEQKSMVFPGFSDEIPDRAFQPGEGMLLADGHGIQQVKFSLIGNEADWCAHIRAIMDGKHGGTHEADAPVRERSE